MGVVAQATVPQTGNAALLVPQSGCFEPGPAPILRRPGGHVHFVLLNTLSKVCAMLLKSDRLGMGTFLTGNCLSAEIAVSRVLKGSKILWSRFAARVGQGHVV